MTIDDNDIKMAVGILSIATMVGGMIWSVSKKDAKLASVEKALSDITALVTAQHLEQCEACVRKHQLVDALVSDLRDETRAELGRRAESKAVERLDATSVEHGRLIERMGARLDGLADGQARIERGVEHIAARLDAREA